MKNLLFLLLISFSTAPIYAQQWESVRTGEFVMQLPEGAVIIDCQAWEWRRIGQPSTATPIIKHHPAYKICIFQRGEIP